MKLMEGPFSISNVVIMENTKNSHQALMTKITDVLDHHNIGFTRSGEHRIIAKDCSMEIRKHKALQKATQGKDHEAYLLHFGKGFDQILAGNSNLKD